MVLDTRQSQEPRKETRMILAHVPVQIQVGGAKEPEGAAAMPVHQRRWQLRSDGLRFPGRHSYLPVELPRTSTVAYVLKLCPRPASY